MPSIVSATIIALIIASSTRRVIEGRTSLKYLFYKLKLIFFIKEKNN
jgi:hypothetical protein